MRMFYIGGVTMRIGDVRVIIEKGPLSAEDAQFYIEQIKKSSKLKLKKVTFTRTDAYLDLRYAFEGNPFERLRRVALTSEPPEDRAVNG